MIRFDSVYACDRIVLISRKINIRPFRHINLYHPLHLLYGSSQSSMPGTIHTFPSPPRPKQQKRLNGHAKPDGLAQENGHGGPSSSSSAPETLQHVSPTRSRSEAGSEIMDYDSDDEEMADQGVLVHGERLTSCFFASCTDHCFTHAGQSKLTHRTLSIVQSK